MYSYGSPHMAVQKQDEKLEKTSSSYVKIRDVALKTCQRRWAIGRSGKRASGISVPVARHDDDDDDSISYNLYYIIFHTICIISYFILFVLYHAISYYVYYVISFKLCNFVLFRIFYIICFRLFHIMNILLYFSYYLQYHSILFLLC